MNAARVVKKRKNGNIFPKKITLIMIDNTNYEEYNIPITGFRIHPEYLNTENFVPGFCLAVGFAKFSKSTPKIKDLPEMIEDAETC